MSPANSSGNSTRAQQQEYVAVGRVARPHGVRGNLLVEPISDLIQSLEAGSTVFLGPDKESAEIVFLKPHRNRYLMSLDICQSREEAETRRQQELYLSTAQGTELPPGTYYHWQIVGLRVETEGGEELGVVERILVTGANDVYLIKDADEEELLLPAIEEVILEVDLEAERMVVKLLPGLRPE